MIGNVIYVVLYGPPDDTEAIAAYTSQAPALERALALAAENDFDPIGYESPDDALAAYNDAEIASGRDDVVYIAVEPVIVEG